MNESSRNIIIATWIGIIVNIILTIIKAVGGWLSGSRALIADAAHSASDIASSVVILFAVKIADKHLMMNTRMVMVKRKTLPLLSWPFSSLSSVSKSVCPQ